MTVAAARLRRQAQRLFGEQQAAQVFEPLLADWHHEWRACAATHARARCLLRGTASLLTAAALTALTMAAPWRAEPVLRRRTLTTLIGFGVLGLSALLLPLFWTLGARAGLLLERAPLIVVAMIVTAALGAAALSLSLALLPTGAWLAGSRRAPSKPARAWLLTGLVVMTTTVTVLLTSVLEPASRAGYARVFAPTHMTAAVSTPREWTSARLAAVAGSGSADSAWARAELGQRLGVALTWPLAAAFLGWRIGRHRASSTRSRVAWWTVVAGTALPLAWFGQFVDYVSIAPPAFAAGTWLLAAALLRRPHEHGALRQ